MASKDSDTDKKTELLAHKEVQRGADSLEDFINYVSSPWRLIWTNFVAGIFRGLGAVVGASIVIALCIWVLSLFVSMPLIGRYFEQVRDNVSGYIEQNNYNDEFDRMGDSLERIEGALTNQDEPTVKR
uniref:Uncharacterized protein n=1 Tax=uncultured Thiotrichaceae bacterium TaxID=298394 RepID=A0A6S6UL51_9GAMM|nr:MAG: Unknown protein [uncultured Thiotrichaceae bacterium]